MASGTTPTGATMPSDRKQLNIRLDAETEDRVERLLVAVSASLGLKVSQSDLFRLGMIELEKRFASEPAGKKNKK